MALTKRLEHLHAAELAVEEDGAVQGVEGADHAEQEHLEAAWRRQRAGQAGVRHPGPGGRERKARIVRSREQKFQ